MADSQPVAPPTVGARIAQGRRFLGVREGRDITPADLAERVGVSAQSVYNWENDVSPPGEKNLGRLADVLRVTPAYLRYGVTEGSEQLERWLRLLEIIKEGESQDVLPPGVQQGQRGTPVSSASAAAKKRAATKKSS